MTRFEKIFLLGVGLDNITEREVLEFIITGLRDLNEKYYIVTPNPEILVIANNNKNYKRVLNGAELALPDGIGVVLAGKLLGKKIKQRITGIGLMESICKEVSKRPITVGFLGAGPNIAVRTSECLREKYPGLKVAFAGEEWKFGMGPVPGFPPASARSNLTGSNELRAVGSPSTRATPASSFINHKSLIINHGIDILFVAFGSPKQEIWISENLEKLPVRVAIGVGGAFDFISGKVPRAPKFVRNLGLEWLFRLVIQPWRIKRQLSLITFVLLILREKFRKK